MADMEKDLELETVDEEIAETEGSESKAAKFKRLSAPRIQKAAKAIDLLGNLANTSSYEYTPEDIEKMFSYLQKQLDDVKAKFETSTKKFEEFNW
jgi:hypothetical protein